VAFFTNYLILKLSQSDAAWVQTLKISEYNWRWMLGIETIPAILYFIFLFFVPNSPRWLAMRGEEEKAMQILTKAGSKEEALEVLNAVKLSMKDVKEKQKTPIKELFKPALKLVLFIGIAIAILQQITGINAVFFYAPMIFEQTGIGTDASFSQAILVGLTNLVFTILAMGLIDRIGRKMLLIIGFSGIFISMGILALSFASATYQIDMQSITSIIPGTDWSSMQNIVFNSDLEFRTAIENVIGLDAAKENLSSIVNQSIHINSWMVLIGIIGFVASFAISVGPVMWVLFSELFPNAVRGLAISFAGFINSGVSFTVQLIFPWELQTIGSTSTFLIYGVFGLLGLAFVLLYLPETRGKSLEEVEKLMVKE